MVKRKNKRGWIKVFEAFVAVILLIGLLMVIIQTQDQTEERTSFLKKSQKIIEEIRINESLRGEVNAQTGLPTYSNESGFSQGIKDYLETIDTAIIECYVGICYVDDPCIFIEDSDEIFSKESLFFGTKDEYKPRKVKAFCVKNED